MENALSGFMGFHGALGLPRRPLLQFVEALSGRIPVSRDLEDSTSNFAMRERLPWFQASPAQPCRYAIPTPWGSEPVDFSPDLASDLPELGVLELDAPYVFGVDGWIATRDGVVLRQHTYHNWGPNEMRWPAWSGRVRRISGRVVSLVSDWAGVNYCHLLLDCLGRTTLLDAAIPDWRNADAFIVPAAKLPVLRGYLERLNIPWDKCIELMPGVCLRPERLLAPTFPGLRRNYSPLVAGLRCMRATPGPASRRVFIKRSKGLRAIETEDQLLAILERRGFEPYDPAGRTSQPEDFATFDVVVGAHGAGLANIVFCQPGTRVVELFPSNYTPPYYFTLSQAIGLRYFCCAGRPTVERIDPGQGVAYSDYVIDVPVFTRGIDELLANSAEGNS